MRKHTPSLIYITVLVAILWGVIALIKMFPFDSKKQDYVPYQPDPGPQPHYPYSCDKGEKCV